jgi:carboxyl-terminal processing protease
MENPIKPNKTFKHYNATGEFNAKINCCTQKIKINFYKWRDQININFKGACAMCHRFFKFFVFPAVLLFALCSLSGVFQLKRTDVRVAMEEMLAYHVEYKEFSSFLARRSLRVYIQQFDAEKQYLLASEALPYLDLKEERSQSVVKNYYKDDLSEYANLNVTIQKAIVRARAYRAEVERELIQSDELPKATSSVSHLDYATSERELKSRIKNQLTHILSVERSNGTLRAWNAEQRQKLFTLWERRFSRMENTYLPAAGLSDHYLCMHVLKALAKSLDAHSSYFSPEEAYEMRTSLEKQFEGIGVVLREGIDGVVIHAMIKGGPAERSGLIAPGDLLVEIDGAPMEGSSYDDVLKRLQGSGKGPIKLGLRRFDTQSASQLYYVELRREKIVMQEDRVSYSFEPFGDGIIGKLNLPSFYESGEGSSCEMDLRVALKELKKRGKLQGLVLDMRENSGGFLTQAVKVTGLFITCGVVVISKYAKGETQYLRDLDGRSYYDGPLVILTSKGSASAAEIVAQALQDYGAGLVVGDERTYGKGTIQYQTVTDTSAASFFKVTVGRYYTVSGRTTQIDGVRADIVVPTSYAHLMIGERYLEYPLKSDRIPSAFADPLTDVDPRNRAWFQKNYLPNLQKKLSLWTQMLSQLKENSAYRLKKNKDYTSFLTFIGQDRKKGFLLPTAENNWGLDDLQMIEAVNILKDMTELKPQAAKQVALFIN